MWCWKKTLKKKKKVTYLSLRASHGSYVTHTVFRTGWQRKNRVKSCKEKKRASIARLEIVSKLLMWKVRFSRTLCSIFYMRCIHIASPFVSSASLLSRPFDNYRLAAVVAKRFQSDFVKAAVGLLFWIKGGGEHSNKFLTSQRIHL